jgi:hypothetical protein
MFGTDPGTPLFPARGQARALEAWQEAEDLVKVRWQAFLQADAESRSWTFASYVAALDAEEAAAAGMAMLSQMAA